MEEGGFWSFDMKMVSAFPCCEDFILGFVTFFCLVYWYRSDMTHSFICNMTHSYMRHDLFIHCDVTYSFIRDTTHPCET